MNFITAWVGSRDGAPAEFLAAPSGETSPSVNPGSAPFLSPDKYDTWQDFIAGQAELWFGDEVEDLGDPAWTVELGEKLRTHMFFRNLVRVLGNKVLALDEIAQQLCKIDASLAGAESFFVQQLVESMLALVSAARLFSYGCESFDVWLQKWVEILSFASPMT